MNLKLRLNLITTSLLLVLMLAGVTLSANNARKNAIAEIASAEQSAVYLFDHALVKTPRDISEKLDLSAFKLAQLSHMRHLKIALIDKHGQTIDSNQLANKAQLKNKAPIWFERILNKTMPQWQPVTKILKLQNAVIASLVITPDPSYEYAEIWKQLTDLFALLALFFICVNATIYWAIAQALKPTNSILSALDKIESGHLDTRLPAFQLPELAKIGQKFNHMIETLQLSILNNQQLTQQMMTLQDAERKSLARDLHDEFGQCLTAIHTDASVILKVAKLKYPELQAGSLAITQLSRHLMEIVSGLLQRLRPSVLDELGLDLALNDLLDVWRSRNRNISCTSSINAIKLHENQLNDAQQLAIYRLVQESLTNIERHANATNIDIILTSEVKNAQTGVAIKVTDNGVGLNLNHKDGLGLAGMRERILALSGEFDYQKVAKKGCVIYAWLPLKSVYDAK